MTTGGSDWARVKRELLAVLELEPGAGREQIRALADESPELAAEVAALVAGVPASAGFLERPALERAMAAAEAKPWAPRSPERVGPWRLEAEIGRGGMGTVWRGRRDDGAFEQVVAVKFVRPEFATDLLRRRLVAERSILAGLGHEGIARLLDGGVTGEGVPYLVLEYVDGQPIDAWCDQRALPVAARLRLFLEVCAAVEFAHRKLVLHRDIKSSNVLVDERGRPKLLDFGIARLLGPEPADEDWTALGLGQPLTPEWASPEQLRGDPLTTASDVYSLGVLLCALLTGQRPHRWTGQSAAALALEIEESGGGQVAGLVRGSSAPGVESRVLRGDLERILGRALAPEIERRYGSPAELAADLERFLDGRPVSAHPPSVRYRVARFVRRHRAAVAAAAVAAASLLAATAVSVRQARVADAERQRAERRFGEVRQLANRFLFEFEEMIRDLPGSTPARERVARTAREYLDRLAAEAGDDAGLLDELAQAYLKVGDLEGHPQLANLGRPADARASYQRALALALRIVARDPATLVGRWRQSTAELRLGDLALDAGDDREAEARFGAALAAAEGGVAIAPRDRAGRRQFGQALQRLGSVRLARGDSAAALALFERYRDSAAALLAEAPEAAEARRDLLVAWIYLGDGRDGAGQRAAALDAFQQALRLGEARRREHPGFQADRDWSVTVQRVLMALRKLGRHQEALVHAREGQAWAERAAAADPANRLLRRDLAEGFVDLGREQGAVGRWPEALASLVRGRRLFEELVRAEPDSAVMRRDEGSALFFEAEALAATGRTEEAGRAARRALELEESLLAARPDDAELRQDLADARRLAQRLAPARGAPAGG